MKSLNFLKHPLFKTGLVYTLCDAINKSVPFLILPILSYYLSPSDYGIIANFNVLLSIATILIMVGIDGAISVSFYKLGKQDMAKYIFNGLSLITVSCLIVLLLVFLLSDYIYLNLKIPSNFQFLLILMAYFSCISSLNLSLWRLEEKAISYGVYEILQTILNLSLSAYFVIVLLEGWKGRVNAMMIATIVFGLFSLLILFTRGYLKIKIYVPFLREILIFGLPIIPHALSFWIRSSVDRVLITSFVGEEATGLYATGFQFGVLISFFTYSFNNAFAPYIYKKLSVNDDIQLMSNKINLVKISYLVMIGLIIISVVFMFCSIFFLQNFFSNRYLESQQYIYWAILAQTFQGFYLLFVNYIFFVKKTRFLAFITFTCSLLQVVLSFVLIRQIGALGAAYSTVLISFINFMAIAYYSNIVCKMPWFNFKGVSTN